MLSPSYLPAGKYSASPAVALKADPVPVNSCSMAFLAAQTEDGHLLAVAQKQTMNELIDVTIADGKDARLDMDVWGDRKRVRKVIARKFGELNRQVRVKGGGTVHSHL
jgi:hypothetical protein